MLKCCPLVEEKSGSLITDLPSNKTCHGRLYGHPSHVGKNENHKIGLQEKSDISALCLLWEGVAPRLQRRHTFSPILEG